MNKFKNKNFSTLNKIPLIIIAVFAVGLSCFLLGSGSDLTVESIILYVPDNLLLAAIILLSLFALKSLSVVFPLSMLYLASGLLFTKMIAIIVSTTGLILTISIPYVIGRHYGNQLILKLVGKYPAVKKLEEFQDQNQFFSCFITRFCGFLPCDILSLYFGACQVPYGKYALAGVLGSLLSILTTTLMGTQLNNIFSKEFAIILCVRIILSFFSVIGYRKLNSKMQN